MNCMQCLQIDENEEKYIKEQDWSSVDLWKLYVA